MKNEKICYYTKFILVAEKLEIILSLFLLFMRHKRVAALCGIQHNALETVVGERSLFFVILLRRI